MTIHKIAVIGSGSWGTALAAVLANNHHQVTLYSRKEMVVDEINSLHTNSRYLPEILLPGNLFASSSLKETVETADAIVLSVPSHAMRETIQQIQSFVNDRQLIIHTTKGLELSSFKRMSEVIAEELSPSMHANIVVLSGPSHAEDVACGLPTTVTVASSSLSSSKQAQALFNNSFFRVYTVNDVIGVELGGSLKNVIAIGAGLSDGLQFGDNAKAALLTRGLSEMTKLAVKLGANPVTLSGLAGMGDLIVTGTSVHSRNWKTGFALASGKDLETILSELGMVAEGVKTTKSIYELASALHIEMPITEQIYKVLFEKKDPSLAVQSLMDRFVKDEF